MALTESENQETARKACLDIISAQRMTVKEQDQAGEVEKHSLQLSAETASRLLAALAQAQNQSS